MAKQTFSPIYNLHSVTGAAGIDDVAFCASGEPVTVQVYVSPGDLVRVMGSLDGAIFALLSHVEVGGTVAAMSALAAGFYTVRERVKWIRFGVNQDASGPLIHSGQFLVHEHD